MEWLESLLEPSTLFFLLATIVVVSIFIVAVIRANRRHDERIEKVKNSFDPKL